MGGAPWQNHNNQIKTTILTQDSIKQATGLEPR